MPYYRHKMKDMRGKSFVVGAEGGDFLITHAGLPAFALRYRDIVIVFCCPQRQLCPSRGLIVFDSSGKAAICINNVIFLWPAGVSNS